LQRNLQKCKKDSLKKKRNHKAVMSNIHTHPTGCGTGNVGELIFVVPQVIKLLSNLFGRDNNDAEINALRQQINAMNEHNAVVAAQNQQMQALVQELRDQNNDLTTQIEDLLAQVARVEANANLPERQYNEIKEFFDHLHRNVIRLPGNNSLLMGPKGSGKSTYLKFRDPTAPDPVMSVNDGTTNLIRYNQFMDSIGIDIDVTRVLRLFCLLLNEGFPNTLITFHTTERLAAPSMVLSAFLITNYYNVIFDRLRCFTAPRNGQVRLDPENHPLAWYELCETAGFRMLRNTDNLTMLNSFEPMLSRFFPDGSITLPAYPQHMALLEDVANRTGQAMKFAMLKLFKQLLEMPEGANRASDFMKRTD
jgi:hypothetical protein